MRASPVRTPVESRRRLSALLRRALAGAVLAVAATAVHAQPAVPAGLTVAPVARTTDELLVSWTAVAGADTYDIDIKRSADTDFQVGAEDIGANRGPLIDLDPNTAYDVRVRATDGDGDSAWAATVQGWTHAPVEELHYSEEYGRIPRGVGPGESFRLLTITGSTAATSTNVGTYHEVARSGVRENGFRDYFSAPHFNSGYSYTEGHRALVSTPGVDARTHTDTTWTGTDRGVPIHWWGANLDGTRAGDRVADDYADFYDGAWQREIGSAATQPWTGSAADGTERKAGATSHAMGAARVGTAGMGDAVDGGPLDGPIAANTETRPVFALSHVYKVVEAPEDPPLPHPRVLLDTTLTVGEYDTDGDQEADRWGYVSPFFQPSGEKGSFSFARTKPSENLPAGRLGGDQFLHKGLTTTLYRFLWRENGFEYHALPNIQLDGSGKWSIDGRIGYELGTGSAAVMIALPANASDTEARESLAFHRALTDWPGAVGSEVSLRVLNLDVADIWSAVLVPGRAPGGPTGFAADGPGTLSRRTFYWNGVEYTVDRLAVGATERGPGLQFSTTPDLPEGLRLTVPERSDVGGRFRYPTHVYPLERAMRGTATGVDYEWPGARTAWAWLDDTDPVSVYLTTPPRAQHVQRELWAATLTPGRAATAADTKPVLGYWPADELPPTPSPVTGAPGTLTPVAAQVDGVAYTVDALAMVSEADLWLRTTPPLPKGRGLTLELEVAGGVLPLSVDAAELRDYGYRWPLLFEEEARPGWGADSDEDGTLDPRRVRLVRWGTSDGVRASVSPPSAAEGGGTATVTVTATLDGRPSAADLPVTVTIGAAADTAATAADYTALAIHTLTLPADGRSASVDVEIAVADDSVAEPLEEISVAVEVEGRGSAVTAFAIADDDHEEIEYWSATLRGARSRFRDRVVDGHLVEPDATRRGGALSTNEFRCCSGRQRDDVHRRVWALARDGDEFVLGMTGLVRDGVVAPEFQGATVRIGDRLLAPERARVVEPVPGTKALAWDAELVTALSGSAVEVRLSGPDHAVLQDASVVSTPYAGPTDDRRYGAGEVIEFALGFDEPVAVTGAPALAFTLGTAQREAAYAYGSGGRELVFAYVVQDADADDDGIDAERVADALSLPEGAAIVSARYGFAAVYGDVRVSGAGQRVDGSRAGPGSPTLTVRDAVVGEDAGTVTLTAALSHAAGAPVSVDWATEDGTAQAPGDYAAGAATLTVPAGARLAMLTVDIEDDAEVEADERFSVMFSNPPDGLRLARGRAGVTVVDDDGVTVAVAAPPPPVGMGADAYFFEAEAAGRDWTVSAARPVPADLAVDLRVSETGAGDFVASGDGVRRVTIPAGARSTTFNPVRDDEVDEGHGTVTVAVLAGDGYAPAAVGGAATVTVRDDDFATAPLEFALSPASGTVLEGGALAMEQVVRTVADGTFTAVGDLARAIPGFEAARLRWGAVTHLETAAGDIAVTVIEAAVADFVQETAADGGVGLVARRPLGSVTAADDGVDEGAERVIVALERTGGDARLLRAAEHPGAAGFDQALADGAFYGVALTVRDQALMLVPETTGLDEGQSMTVRATMMPPRAAAFEVTLSLDSTARLDFEGMNRTLSFAPGATDSTGTVTLRAKRTPPGDGSADAVLTGTPNATAVSPASTTLRVHDGGATAGGAILWETELTVGAYTDDNGTPRVNTDNTSRYGYADTGAGTGLMRNTAGALDDATFEFQGVEYTVRRLTLGSSTETAVADLRGEFAATDARGIPLPVGRPPGLSHPALLPELGNGGVTAVKLGLEVEGAGGVTRMRPLQSGTDSIGVLAPGAAWEAAVGETVTVRLIDLGPTAWWNARVQPAVDPDMGTGYWVDGGVPNGALLPDAFELEDANGQRVLHTVDRLTVMGGGRVLRFSTTPDVPADVASLMVSRQDFWSYNPADSPPPTDLYHVLPLTSSARSTLPGVDYAFTLPADSSAVSGEALGAGIARAMLVPRAGAGSAAPPPPALEEVWRADVTVAERCRHPLGAATEACDVYHTGAGDGQEGGTGRQFGDLSDWSLPRYGTQNRPTISALRFERYKDGRTDLTLIPNLLRIRHSVRFEGNPWDGLEIQGDYGARMHWGAHFLGGPELDTVPWLNVDPGHGWDAGEVHRVRLMRARVGATHLDLDDAEARVAPDGQTVQLRARVGYEEALPRGVDTAVRVTAYRDVGRVHGVSKDITIPARAPSAAVEMEVPMPDDHGYLTVTAASGLFGEAGFQLPLIWSPEDPQEVEYWSGSLHMGELDRERVGFSDVERTGLAFGALTPRRFACCGAPVESAAVRTVWALGQGREPMFPGRQQLVLGLDGIGAAAEIPDDLRGATLHLEQVAYLQPNLRGDVRNALVTVRLPLDDAVVGEAVLPGSDTGAFLTWEQFSVTESSYPGEYRVRLTGPDRAVLTAVDTVSVPRAGPETDPKYGAGDVVAIRLRFDEPVAVIGAPTLTFGLGAGDRTAAYAYGAGTAELVFEYAVQATDSDPDGIDVAAFPGALTFADDGGIESVAKALDAVYAAYDPPAWPAAKVDGSLAGVASGGVSLLDTTVSEGAGVARLTAVLDAEAAVPRTFAYGTADGTALAGSDYRASTGTVTVVPGQRSATFEIAVLDDAELEGEERFTVWLARSGTMLAEAQVTVIENDVPTVTLTGPSLAANGGHVFEHETEAAAMWTLRRPKAALGAPLTVRLTVEERGSDFVPAPGEGLRTVEFLPTQTAVMFTPVVDDDTDDAHGTVTVRLEPDTGYVLGSPELVETVVAVRDDDGRLVSMRLEPAALTVREGAAAEVTVVAETLPREATTFTGPDDLGRVLGRGVFLKATTMTTDVDTDAADLDHLEEGYFETLQFPDFWETADGGLAIGRAVRVQTHADTVSDDGEQFGIHLSVLADDTLGGRVVVGEPSQSVVTIREGGATLALVFSPDTIAEGRTSEVTATVDTARDAAWTVAVSAQSADDSRWGFADGNRTLSFAAHATASTGAVTIRALPNERNEADLDVTVRGSPDAATGLAAVERLLTVADDDPEELHYSEVYGRIPADIGPGDSFRLLSIVGNTTGTSTDLRTYDAVAKAGVRHGFDDEPSASKLAGGFTYTEGHRALVSTPDVDARTHTGTAYTATDRGVPIYWWSAILNGSRPTRRVADDYADFYDGAWPAEPDREAARQPWTGSAADGTARPGHALGAAEVGTGGIGAAAGGPLDGAPAANTEMRPVYALSQVYRVVDAPEDPPLTHPRVLLDTTLTIGAYDASGDGVADRWGYANPLLQPRNIPEHPRTTAVSAGRLGGDQWLVASLPATLYRLLWRAQTEPLAGVTEQASGGGFEYHALPLVPWDGSFKDGIGGRSGLELGTESTAVLIEQFGADNRLTPTSRRWLHDALSGWRHAVGRTVSLRVLNLANSDIWTAVLSPARSAGGAVGFVAGAAGAVSRPTFFWNGVEYRVDRLVFDASSARGLQFATTPSLPDGLRLAVPDQPDSGGAFGSPVYYYPLQAGARSTAPGVDFEWASARTGWAGAGNTSPLTVYLTQAPGAQRVKRELWTGDLTAGSAPFTGRRGSLEGYWDAGVELPAAVEGSGAVGVLTPAQAEIDGVTYTVDGLARVSGSPLWLHTTPDLPAGRGLVLEVEAGRGVVPLAIDAASARAYGYEWEFTFNEYAGDTPWGGDGDVTPDARRVRLVRWGSPGGALRASVTPSYAREGASAVPAVTVTADLEGLAPDVDTPVTVTFGAADDSAAPPADYDPVTVPTLTVPAGQRSASVTVNVPIADDAAAELIEHATVGIAADGWAPHATEFAITDDDHEQIEYWSATLTGAQTALRGRTVAGYIAEPGSATAPGGALDPVAFRCCAGRQRDDAQRTVWALGQIDDDFVLGMSGLVRNGAVAPEFRGATVRIGDRLLAPERARVVEPLPGTPALAWDADLVDAPPGSAVEVRLSGPDHPVLQEATVVSMPSGGSAEQRRYGDGEVIDLSLRFDEPVEVTGTPVLALTVGTERREAGYAYGSGTRELVFAYVVRGGDVDDDGIDAGSVADALSLPSGAAIASSRYGFAPVYGVVRVSTAAPHPVDGDRAKPGSPSLTVHDVEVQENAGTATLTAALSFASDTPVTMDWATADRTAQAPGDYTRVASHTLTVPADERFATLTVGIRDDAETEDDERFAVVFSNANVPLARDEAEVTIRDDETMVVSIAPPTLTTNGGHVFEHEAAEAGGTAATHWVLTRDGPTAAALGVDVRASETGGGDFVGTETASVTFAAGADRAFYSPVANDATDEGHGTVTVTVQPREDAYETASGNASAAAAVRDDDGTLLTVKIEAEATAVEGAPAVFGVRAENTDATLTEAGDLERLFGVTTVAVTASTADGSATAGSDYTALTDAPASIGTFESQSGGASWVGRVSVETLDDAPLVDDGETFTVTLSLPASTDPRIALSPTEATGTAMFVEGSVLTFSVTPAELAEGATATVTAAVDPAHDAQFTVTVAGMSDDAARWEFVGGATTLTFATGQAAPTGSVSIRAIPNDVDDGDLAVELTATPSVATVVAQAPVVLTVLDDDLPRVSIAAPGLARDTGHLFEHEAPDNRWELTRAGLTEVDKVQALTVDVSVSDTGAFTAGAATTVTFGAGMDTTPYTPITDDDVDEAHGTVTVTLLVDSGSEYAVDPDAASASVDVRDDDATPTLLTISLEPSSLTVSEGAAARFEVVAVTVFDDTFTTAAYTAPGDLDRVFSVQNLPVVVSSTDGTAMSDDGDYEKKETTTTVAFADFSAFGTGSARGLRGRFATDVVRGVRRRGGGCGRDLQRRDRVLRRGRRADRARRRQLQLRGDDRRGPVGDADAVGRRPRRGRHGDGDGGGGPGERHTTCRSR